MFGAIGSVLSSILGGISQNKSIDKQNEANAAENQKNRDFNARQADLAYNRQRTLIAEAREYDSAKAQRERLEAAGLNPYLMMDGGNAGTTQSMSAPPAASAPSPIPMQARRYEWMQNMAMQAAQINLVNAQAKNVGEDANLKAKQAGATERQGNLWFEQAEHQRIVNNVDSTYYEQLVKTGIAKTDAEKCRIDGQRLNESIASILSQRQFAIMTPAQLGNLVADTALKEAKRLGINVETEQGRITLSWLGSLYGAQYLLTQNQAFAARQQGNLFGSQLSYYDALAQTENDTRLFKLNNMSLTNDGLFTRNQLLGEDLKQSRWKSWEVGRTTRAYAENYVRTLEMQIGAWREGNGNLFDHLMMDLGGIERAFLNGGINGLGSGLGFGLGQKLTGHGYVPPVTNKYGSTNIYNYNGR